MRYQTRRGELKSAIHWGQRKLFLSELQLLVAAFSDVRQLAGLVDTSNKKGRIVHIVYPGAAPGSHLALLDDWFPGRLRWTLVDPNPCDVKLSARRNFTLVEDYFTDSTALKLAEQRFVDAKLPALGQLYGHHFYQGLMHSGSDRLQADKDRLQFKEHGVKSVDVNESVAATAPRGLALLANAALDERAPMLFVCDIRSGSVSMQENAVSSLFESAAHFEAHVQTDMLAQMQWVDLLLPSLSLLKFRLPYMEVLHPVTKEVAHRHHEEATSYLAGRVLLPIWTRPTSSEGRLLVRCPRSRRLYNNRLYEDQCFFFNSVVRERIHFDHVLEGHRASFLDHRYDASAEVNILEEYLNLGFAKGPHATTAAADPKQLTSGEAAAILAKSEEITSALGKSFLEASERLPRVMMEKAKLRGFEASQRALEAATSAFRDLDVWWRRRDAVKKSAADGHCSREQLGPTDEEDQPWCFLKQDPLLQSSVTIPQKR